MDQPVGERVFVALGSNLGDRAGHIEQALCELDALRDVQVVARSGLYETEPVGGPPNQPLYLNAAAELRTRLEPQRLLAELLAIERVHGRLRRERFGPRTLDLDLLLYGFRSIRTERLTVPHPRMWERAFVLVPLGEICDPGYLNEVRRRLGIPQAAEQPRVRPVAGIVCTRRARPVGADGPRAGGT